MDKNTPYQTLISAQTLNDHLGNPQWAIIDCRFSLNDTEGGRKDYLQAHIPGAVYAHLDEDLCDRVVPGITGRHPLPAVEIYTQKLSNWGVDQDVQVVVYDDAGGSMAAARLWWMLRWLGHDRVVLLDGGWQHWKKMVLPVKAGWETRSPRIFIPQLRNELLITSEEVEKIVQDPHYRLVDSRTSDRFRGENETIDPVAGRIPGAVSAPYLENLGDDGCFLSKEALRTRFQELVGDLPSHRVIFYCGSGVTAAQNILAYIHSGLGEARLYAGSWSEWITDPARPIETG